MAQARRAMTLRKNEPMGQPLDRTFFNAFLHKNAISENAPDFPGHFHIKRAFYQNKGQGLVPRGSAVVVTALRSDGSVLSGVTGCFGSGAAI